MDGDRPNKERDKVRSLGVERGSWGGQEWRGGNWIETTSMSKIPIEFNGKKIE